MCSARNEISRTQCLHAYQGWNERVGLVCMWMGCQLTVHAIVLNGQKRHLWDHGACANFQFLTQNAYNITYVLLQFGYLLPFDVISSVTQPHFTVVQLTNRPYSAENRPDQSQRKCDDANEDTVTTWYKSSFTAALFAQLRQTWPRECTYKWRHQGCCWQLRLCKVFTSQQRQRCLHCVWRHLVQYMNYLFNR